jgi:hypothetical protein
MPQRFIVTFGSSVIPEEWSDFRCSNTLYYQGVSGATAGEAVAQSIADAYASIDRGSFVFGAIQVRAYDFDGVLPSGPPVAVREANQAASGPLQVPGPREVACALSYRAGPSTPRSRGRIFLGPVAGIRTGEEYIGQAVGNAAKDLGLKLLQIVTLGAEWSLYSRRVQAFAAITNFSVDNAWDTQRSRGLPATANL